MVGLVRPNSEADIGNLIKNTISEAQPLCLYYYVPEITPKLSRFKDWCIRFVD